MESESSSIALVERGDLEPIPRHPDFRVFAAMNPATDAGVSSLPPSVALPHGSPLQPHPVGRSHPGSGGETCPGCSLWLLTAVTHQRPWLWLRAAQGCGLPRAGKRELPAALRNRFTEMYVSEPTALADLRAVVAEYLAGAAPNPPLDAVVDFYIAAKHEAVRTPSYPPTTLRCHG